MGETLLEYDQVRADEELRARVGQQAAVAGLGQRALEGVDIPSLMGDAVEMVAATLRVRFCEIFELLPGGSELLLRAGAGWDKSLVGTARISAVERSQIGRALLTGGPVIVDDLPGEKRFKSPPLLAGQGVVSCLSVRVEGRDGPYGVLCAHSTERRAFTRDDTHFLKSVANVLAAAVGRKFDEEGLRRGERHLRDVIDGLSVFVGVLKPDGTLVEVNRAALRAASLRPEDVLGKPFEETYWWSYTPESKARLRGAIDRAALGQPSRYEAQNRLGEDLYVTIDFMLAPEFDEGGRVTHLIASGVDITERRRLETELVRSSQLSLVGELAAGLAHEVKNPLAGIKGAVEIILRRRSPDDPEREVLEDVLHAVTRIDETVRTLLERARPRPPQLAPASINEVAHRAVSLARHHAANSPARARDVTVAFEPAAAPLVLPVDAAQVEDAVLNLVLNGIDAAEGDGRVVVRVRGGDAGAVIEVEDDGRGIPEEHLKRVFEPFYTTRPGGTGLGLAAVRRVARAHGGRVEVSSVPGRGSTFRLHLPAAVA